MKTPILFLLLFSSTVWGQEPTFSSLPTPSEYYIAIKVDDFAKLDTTKARVQVIDRTVVGYQPERQITLSDLSQFLDECWNDSTAVRGHISTAEWCSMTGYPSRCGDPSHYRDYYTHRLEDASAMEVMREFVKWMEKK